MPLSGFRRALSARKITFRFPASGFRRRAQHERGGESALSRFPLSGLNQRTARAPQRGGRGGNLACPSSAAVEDSSTETGNRKVPVSGFRFPAALLSPCLSCSHHARQPSTVFQIRSLSHREIFLPKLSTFQLPASVLASFGLSDSAKPAHFLSRPAFLGHVWLGWLGKWRAP